MEKIVLLVDNSNIQVTTQHLFGKEARFSYKKFENHYKEYNTIEKYMIGSVTQNTNLDFWKKMESNGYLVYTYERSGKEKGVDGNIIAKGTEAIIKNRPDYLILLSGDLDMRPLIEIAQKYNCKVHLWSYQDSLSQELQSISDEVFLIDNYLADIIYFQYGNDTESYVEHQERIEQTRNQNKHQEKGNWKRKVWAGLGVAAAIAISIFLSRNDD